MGFGIIICDADAPGRQWDSPGPVRENKEKKVFFQKEMSQCGLGAYPLEASPHF